MINKSAVKVAFLDAGTLQDAVDLSPLKKLAQLELYPSTSSEEVDERIADADVVITNKVRLTAKSIARAARLRLIIVAASKIEGVDVDAANENRVEVVDVGDYATQSVAQLTIAMMLSLLTRLGEYDQVVRSSFYRKRGHFAAIGEGFRDLTSCQVGIVGLGRVGTQVGRLVDSLGCRVVYCTGSRRREAEQWLHVNLKDLLTTSDVVTIHTPLTSGTRYLIDWRALESMRPDSILINTGRGGVVNELELARAIEENEIWGAGLDVFEEEPLPSDSPLLRIKARERLVLTPHIGWGSHKAQKILVRRLAERLAASFGMEVP